MSALRFFKPDTNVVARLLIISAFAIVMLVTLGLGRPAHTAVIPHAMCQPCSSSISD